MPNHVRNQLTIEATNLDQILKMVRNEDCIFDFEKIVPMLESLHIEAHSGVIEHAKYIMNPSNHRAKWHFDLSNSRNQNPSNYNDNEWDCFFTCLNNIRKYGYAYWYDWSIENWGTKWDAYGFPKNQPAENIIRFETAWSCPVKVIQKLAKIFPNAKFKLEFADEDMGYNLGVSYFNHGENTLNTHPEFGSNEAWIQAYSLRNPNSTESDLIEELEDYKQEESNKLVALWKITS